MLFVGQEHALGSTISELPTEQKNVADGLALVESTFFGIGLVILQVEIDSLRNFHGVPPVVRVVWEKYPHRIIHHGALVDRWRAWWFRKKVKLPFSVICLD